MKFLVPVDQNSIKENPDAGRTMYHIPGPWQKTANGYDRCIQTVYSIHPEPRYYFDYSSCQVTCSKCGARFPHTDLESEYREDSEDEYETDYICPVCNKENCCELVYQKLNQETGKVVLDNWEIK